MKVLVISGTGWLGSHIVAELVDKGCEMTVIAIGQMNAGNKYKNVNWINCDRTEENSFNSVLHSLDPEVVIDVIPGYFGAGNTQLIVDAFRGRIKHFIHCSSTGVYVPLKYLPADEHHACSPLPIFGDAFIRKFEADKVVLKANREGFPGTIIRPTCIMGAGKLPLDNLGGRSEQFLYDILHENTIFIPNDGQMLLQPVHVKDVARAFALCAGKADSINEVYNISSQNAVTFNEYLSAIRNILKKNGNTEYVPSPDLAKRYEGHKRFSGPDFRFFCQHMCFRIDKARQDLDYNPTYDLVSGLSDTLNWALNEMKFA